MSEKKRGRGRPRKYPKELGTNGAPTLSVRLDPEIYEHIQSRPEGAREYVERIVRQDMQADQVDT